MLVQDFADVPSNSQCPSREGYLASCCCTSVASPMGHGHWCPFQEERNLGWSYDQQISTGSRGTATPITRFEHPSEIERRLPAAVELMIGRHARPPPCKNICGAMAAFWLSNLDHLPKYQCRDIYIVACPDWFARPATATVVAQYLQADISSCYC